MVGWDSLTSMEMAPGIVALLHGAPLPPWEEYRANSTGTSARMHLGDANVWLTFPIKKGTFL